MEIIGLGKAGNKICKLFSEKGKRSFAIDTNAEADVVLPAAKNMEDAETNVRFF